MRTSCNICGSKKLEQVIDLGLHPLADTFWSTNSMPEDYSLVPLIVNRCLHCNHLMTKFEVSAKMRYQGEPYSYTSGNSTSAINHFHTFAKQVMQVCDLKNPSVLDIGGNDGTFLQGFKKLGVYHLTNVEPSENISVISQNRGFNTVNNFFTKKVVKDYNLASEIIISANVLNHVDDLNELMIAVDMCLSNDGVFVFQVPYAPSLIDHCYFETIYHEHTNYFSAASINKLLSQHGFVVQMAEINEYMCDSLRIYCQRGTNSHCPQFQKLISDEITKGHYHEEKYLSFADQAKSIRHSLRNEISRIRIGGKNIIGICAATKANTLLNYCGFTRDDFDCVADTSVLKAGKLMPGSLIPIVNEDAVNFDNFDYMIVLAENFVKTLHNQLKEHSCEQLRIRNNVN